MAKLSAMLNGLALSCTIIYAATLTSDVPTNDNLCDAIAIMIGESCIDLINIELDSSTVEINEPFVTCTDGIDTVIQSVWYSFVAPANPIYLLTTQETDYPNLQMNLFTLNGDCTDLANLELVDCNVPVTNIINSPSLAVTLTEGQTYYVQLSEKRYEGENFEGPPIRGCFSIFEITPPANDDACNAIMAKRIYIFKIKLILGYNS